MLNERSQAGDQTGTPDEPVSAIVPRSVVGGVLMGLANLVPGISGGTMLLASGVYPKFIQAIAELTTLKLRWRSILVLALVVGSAGMSILLLAGVVKSLVVEHRWVMYSLFIGLTLGGIPVVWSMARPPTRSLWSGALGGFLVMAAIAVVQAKGWSEESSAGGGIALMFIAGIIGASAMILPGISGGYMLLVLGVYVPVLGAIDQFKNALKAVDLDAAMAPATSVLIPVGVGVVIGVVAVSNLLKLLLERYEKPTLGCLLGFLAGAVMGLWPFQHGVSPKVGDVFKGTLLTEEALAKLDPSKYPTEIFAPSAGQIAGALACIVLGFLATALVSRLGGGETQAH